MWDPTRFNLPVAPVTWYAYNALQFILTKSSNCFNTQATCTLELHSKLKQKKTSRITQFVNVAVLLAIHVTTAVTVFA